MNLKAKFLDRKGFVRESSLLSLKKNSFLKEGDIVLVADTGYFYNIVRSTTEIELQNNLYAQERKTSLMDLLIKKIEQLATKTEDGRMSKEDKKKLDNISENANNYTHPTEPGWYHIPSGGQQGQSLIYLAPGQVKWVNLNDYYYTEQEINTMLEKKLDKTGGTITQNLTVQGVIVCNDNITAYSDKRLKKNIKKIKSPLKKIKNISGYSYIKNGKNEIGVIAQEVEKIFPELIHTDDNGFKAVAYGPLNALLIECIKKQQKEINKIKKVIHKWQHQAEQSHFKI